LAELLRGRETRAGEHVELAVVALDAARRDLDVLGSQSVLNVLDGKVVGGEPFTIEPDAHGVPTLAVYHHVGHAGQVLQTIDDVAIDVVGDLQGRHLVAGEDQIHDRLGVGFHLRDDRLVDLIGKPAANTAYAVADVVGGFVGVNVLAEADGDTARFGAAGGLQNVDAGDTRDRSLKDLGHLCFDNARRSTGVSGRDGDRRLIDVRILTDRQPRVGDDAEQHQNEAQDRREDGTANAYLDRAHQLFSSADGLCVCTISTSEPLLSLSWPTTTTVVFGSKPERIWTMPAERLPSVT